MSLICFNFWAFLLLQDIKISCELCVFFLIFHWIVSYAHFVHTILDLYDPLCAIAREIVNKPMQSK